MRPPEPDYLIKWRAGPPKCCHTCADYTADGVCAEFEMRPPDDFVATAGACEWWLKEEMPF